MSSLMFIFVRAITIRNMKTDIQIARECQLKPIGDIAAQLGITSEEIEPY